MSTSSTLRERVGWLLTGIVTGAYVLFVAALTFAPRHRPELATDGGRMTFGMGATIIFIVSLVVITGVFLYHSRAGSGDSDQAAAREHGA